MKLYNISTALAWISSLAIYFLVPVNSIEPKLQPDYKEFITLYDNNCDRPKPKQFILKFSYLQDDTIGICISNHTRRTIYIDKRFWEDASDVQKKQLVFHELTHCYLNFGHIEDDKHYMNPYYISLPKETLLTQTVDMLKNKCHHDKEDNK